MERILHFKQTVHRSIQYTTWIIPQIRDGDDKWRIIKNYSEIENPRRVNGYDRFEDGIFKIEKIMKSHGWETVMTNSVEQCHEHLSYQRYYLRCCKPLVFPKEVKKQQWHIHQNYL